MNAHAENRTSPTTPFWNLLWSKALPLETETAFFILVSALDVFMTYILLQHHSADGPRFYESNPVANFFLTEWGISGMVFYKFAMVSIVAVIVQFIAARQIATARRLCAFATVVSCVVILYSLSLFLRHGSFI